MLLGQLNNINAIPTGGESSFSFLGLGGYNAAEKEAADRLYKANEDYQLYIENSNASYNVRAELWEQRNKKIQEISGVQLKNPFQQTRLPVPPPVDSGMSGAEWGDGNNREIYYSRKWREQASEIAKQYPGQEENFIFPEENELAEQQKFTQNIKREAAIAAQSPYLSGWQKTKNEFTGGAVGTFQDPLQLAGLALTPVSFGGSSAVAAGASRFASPAARFFASVSNSVVREAAVNATFETASQAASYGHKTRMELDPLMRESLGQIGMAALLGGSLGGAFDIATRLPWRKIPLPSLAGVKETAEKLGVKFDPFQKRVLQQADDAATMDNASFNNKFNNITEADNILVKERAAQKLDDAAAAQPAGPVPGADYAPPQKPDTVQILTDKAEPAKTGEKLLMSGKPVYRARFSPDDVDFDAQIFQYKQNGDARGVTDRLSGVKKWEETAAGNAFVYEYKDGSRYIGDGHQRLGLAKTAKANGQDNVRLNGFVFREADGWTPGEVRVLAARKNLQEGSGTPMDAALIIREAPEIVDDGLPVTGPMLKSAIDMAKLSDDAFGMVRNGLADERYGALVGRWVADENAHVSILGDVVKAAPKTQRETELLIRDMVAAGFRHETQTDMFGTQAFARSLFTERAKVLDTAIERLKRDKKLFQAVAENDAVLRAAGNVLDTKTNIGIMSDAERIGELITRLSRQRGPVSDALNAAAERLADGSKAAAEAKAFVDEVKTAIEERGLAAVLNERPAEILKPNAHFEPAEQQSVNMAEIARRESGAAAENAQNQTALFDDIPAPKTEAKAATPETAAIKEEPASGAPAAGKAEPEKIAETVWNALPDDSYRASLNRANQIDAAAEIVKNCKK